MKAVGSYIIVKDEEVIQKNDLGLIITEESDLNIRYIIGEVVSVGWDRERVSSCRSTVLSARASRKPSVVWGTSHGRRNWFTPRFFAERLLHH